MPTPAPSTGAEVDDAAILGCRIRQLRKSAGLTLDRVADAAQISASLLSRIERGAAQPSLPTLRTISRALGTPIAALFEGEERSTANEHDAAGRRLVVRHADRRRLKVPDSGIQYELMVPNLDGAVEVIWGAIPPGGGTTHPSSTRARRSSSPSPDMSRSWSTTRNSYWQ